MNKAILIALMLIMSIFTAAAQETEIGINIENEVSVLSEDKCIERLGNYLEDQGKDADERKVKNLCQMLRQKARMNVKTREEGEKLKLELKERIEKNFDKLSKEDQKKLLEIGKDRLENCEDNETIGDCLKDYRIVRFANKADLFRQRTVNGWEKARERFEELQEKFSEIKVDLNEERKAFRDAIKSGNDEAAKDHAKAYLSNVADVVINNLEKIKAKVEENDDLTDDEALEITAKIDAKIEAMIDAKEEVNDAETKEEIKAAGKEIISQWQKMKNEVKEHTASLIKAATFDVLKRAEFLERKLEKALEKLDEKGYDISSEEELLEDYKDYLDSAKENYNLAKDKFAEARETKGNSSELIEDAKEYLNAANSDMRKAHETSKNIIQNIKRIAKDDADELLNETSEDYYEVENVHEDESDDTEELNEDVSKGFSDDSIDNDDSKDTNDNMNDDSSDSNDDKESEDEIEDEAENDSNDDDKESDDDSLELDVNASGKVKVEI